MLSYLKTQATKVQAGVFVHALVRSLRPHQWIKNLVVWAAPLFALQFDGGTLIATAGAFVAFSMVSSGFYLINDVFDVEEDRKHPVKRHRPIAAGLIPIPVATAVAVLLLAVALAGSFTIAVPLGAVLMSYAVLQVGYNLVLKHKTIVDILAIAMGFVLRALSGGAATGIPLSNWFLLCVGLLALFLAIQKRKAELVEGAGTRTRPVLQHYSKSWLDRMEAIVAPAAVVAYALWTVDGTGDPYMLASLPFVIYAIFKYQYLTEHGQGEAPEVTLVRSPHILGAIAMWGATVFFVRWFLQS